MDRRRENRKPSGQLLTRPKLQQESEYLSTTYLLDKELFEDGTNKCAMLGQYPNKATKFASTTT
jgi:hypothetical protein